MELSIINRIIEKRHRKTEFTRMCIAEAIIELLEQTELSKIRVSAVIAKSGFSRMTFYKNYSSVKEALEDYIRILVGKYMEASLKSGGTFREYDHILFSLNFFDEYRRYFLVMKDNGLIGIVLDALNDFMKSNYAGNEGYSLIDIYFYAGGLLNSFLEWEKNRDSYTAEEIATLIYNHYNNR